MTTTTTTNSAPGDAGFVLDEEARHARLHLTMRQMVDADDRGECAAPIELDAGFWQERVMIVVESRRVHLVTQDADGRTVRLRVPAPSATTIGAALLEAGQAIETLP